MIVNGTLANRKYARPKVAVTGRRQVRGSRTSLLKSLAGIERSTIRLVLAALVLVLCGSQFVAWRIGKLEQAIINSSSERKEITDRHIELRSQRVQLMSEKHIQAVAAVRLELFPPGKGQVVKM